MNATLTTVLDLTDQVQAAIDAGDWQRAGDLESERRAGLESLAADPPATGSDLQVALARLQERNQRLIGEVHHHRRRVLREASTIRTGHTAVAAYGDARSET